MNLAELHTNMAKKIEFWPLKHLKLYAKRIHSDAQVDQIAASIAEFGFRK